MFENLVHREKNRNYDGGFTIIEVMIAISIFAIGFLAISSLQFSASRNNRTASDITQAASMAADRMERLMTLPSSHGDLDPVDNPHVDNQGKYDIQWVVTESDLNVDGVNDAKTIRLTVTWARLMQPGSRTRTITMDFIKSDE